MSPSLESRLRECLSETPFLQRLPVVAAPFLERRAKDAAARALEGPNLNGLARVLASSSAAARYLSHRPGLLERIAEASPEGLRARAAELEAAGPPQQDDLEDFLDGLRLTRRDATVLAACLDLGGSLSFEETSRFLSILAEACVRWALQMAETQESTATTAVISVLGMGKVAGRELTYHSDLDLIFLYPDDVTEVVQPSRTAQRLIHYLSTMTGAGVAYAVDSRLRPSGRQGTLISTYQAFDRYQRERAATWEHLALMRARAIAGDIVRAQQLLDHAREAVLAQQTSPWPEVAEMRRRVEQGLGRESNGSIALKTGAGGLMDVDFLAAGGLLERRVRPTSGALPSIPWMLTAIADGPGMEQLLEDYRFLRRVMARTRWVAGRAEDTLKLDGENIDAIAELVEPGLSPEALAGRLAAARSAIRSSYERVIAAGTIGALRS